MLAGSALDGPPTAVTPIQPDQEYKDQSGHRWRVTGDPGPGDLANPHVTDDIPEQGGDEDTKYHRYTERSARPDRRQHHAAAQGQRPRR